jgi:hypothetical protein
MGLKQSSTNGVLMNIIKTVTRKISQKKTEDCQVSVQFWTKSFLNGDLPALFYDFFL